MNTIRSQLGNDYGIRHSYQGVTFGFTGERFLPFDTNSKRSLEDGSKPASGDKFINY